LKKLPIFLFLIGSLLLSCGPAGKEKDLQTISSLEKRLFGDSLNPPKPAVIDSLLTEYGGFAQTYAQDSLAPIFLFKAGELCISTNQGQKALGYFDQVYRLFPNHEKASYALFMKGFIYDGPLQDTAKARQFYTEFIQKYPQHPLSADALFSIRNLGKTDEELIREFEAKLDSAGQNLF
jgi:outer membrane protein assembly factor BamD (BamD/ComL family)